MSDTTFPVSVWPEGFFIAIWPNGDWCYKADIEEYLLNLGLSDDYEILLIIPPPNVDADEFIDSFMDTYIHGGSL